MLNPDKSQAKKFIAALTGDAGTALHFQALDDKKKRAPKKCLYGDLETVWPKLVDYQNKGYGVFITINETDGKGRRLKNITGVRACFVDFDNDKTIPDGLKFHIQTGRDDSHNHFFWRVDGLAVDDFKAAQSSLIEMYGSDPAVKDPSRIMRLAGTYNLKGAPALHKLICSNTHKPYPASSFSSPEPSGEPPSERSASPEPSGEKAPTFSKRRYIEILKDYLRSNGEIPDGERSDKLFSLCARGHDLGLDHAERVEILHAFNWEAVNPPVTLKDIEHISKNVTKYAQNEKGSADPSRDFPTNKKSFGDLADESNPAKDWAYVSEADAFYNTITGVGLKSIQFDRVMMADFADVKQSITNHVLKHQKVHMVDRVTYEPQEPPGVHGKVYNNYRAPNVPQIKGSVAWFHDHIKYLIPDADERRHFIDFFMYNMKFPGKKMMYALLMQGLPGTGKSFFSVLLKECIGASNVSTPGNMAIKDSFNEWMENVSTIIIEELMTTGRVDLMNNLKGWITEPDIYINIKNRSRFKMKNVFNIMAFTNYMNAIRIDQHDRRWLVIQSRAKPRAGSYYSKLFDNLPKKASALLHYAHNDFSFSSDFNPLGRVPETEGRARVIDSGRLDYERDFEVALDKMDSEILTLEDILLEVDPEIKKVPNIKQKLGIYLREQGGEKLGRVSANGARQVLWAVADGGDWIARPISEAKQAYITFTDTNGDFKDE